MDPQPPPKDPTSTAVVNSDGIRTRQRAISRTVRWKATCAVLAMLSLVLAVLALVQWGELRRAGMPPDWGDVPAWVSAFGSLAAFGALFIAALEWRSGQADRRRLDEERRALAAARESEQQDHEMSQARLIIAEPVNNSLDVYGGPTRPDTANANVVVVNHSTAPVFNLHFVKDEGVVVLQRFAGGSQVPLDYPVFTAGQRTQPLMVANGSDTPTVESVEFTFTDARGLQWRRRGSALPTRVIG